MFGDKPRRYYHRLVFSFLIVILIRYIEAISEGFFFRNLVYEHYCVVRLGLTQVDRKSQAR